MIYPVILEKKKYKEGKLALENRIISRSCSKLLRPGKH